MGIPRVKRLLPAFVLLTSAVTLLMKLMPKQAFTGLQLIPNKPDQFLEVQPFSNEDIAECIETLRVKRRARNLQLGHIFEPEVFDSIKEAPYHIAFVGDSRIRQQFYRFSLALPPQDVRFTNLTEYHGEMEASSNLLNLLVTFSWRSNILGKHGVLFLQDVTKWLATPCISKKPDVILLGMALHDMLVVQNVTNHEPYRKRLSKLRPMLEELAKTTRIIWISSYPTYDTASMDEWRGTKIFTEKIHKYNEIAREVFRGSTVYFWESSIALADEYIRACILNSRSSGSPWGLTSYFMCDDVIHPGNVVLSEAMHMLLNEICSRALKCKSKTR